MKIEKIKNFNQIILAILGIATIIFIILLSVIAIIDSRIFTGDNRNYISNSLMSDENVETLNQKNLRKQIVSYESPWLIDTLKAIYMIPVSVTTLDKPEKSSDNLFEVAVEDTELMSLMDVFPHKGYYKKQFFQEQYANLIHYQPATNKTTLLFNNRIMLNHTQAYYFKDDILLIFNLYEKDTDNDGFINMDDDCSLCIYSLKNEKIQKITDGINSVRNYQFIENSKNLLVEFSLNQYKDIKFKSHYKPSKVMKYEFETEKLTEIVPPKIQEQMQKLIEGKNNNSQ